MSFVGVSAHPSDLSGYSSNILKPIALDEALRALANDQIENRLNSPIFKTALALAGVRSESAQDFLDLDRPDGRHSVGHLRDIQISQAALFVRGVVVFESLRASGSDAIRREGAVFTEGVILTPYGSEPGLTVIDVGAYMRSGFLIKIKGQRNVLIDPHLSTQGNSSELGLGTVDSRELGSVKVLEFLDKDGSAARFYIGPNAIILSSHIRSSPYKVNLDELGHLGLAKIDPQDATVKNARQMLQDVSRQTGSAHYNLLRTNPGSDWLVGIDITDDKIKGVHVISQNSKSDISTLSRGFEGMGILSTQTQIKDRQDQLHDLISIEVQSPQALHHALDGLTTILRNLTFRESRLSAPPQE